MPKKKKKNDGSEERKSHNLLNTIIVIIIILFWLAIFAIFIKLDIGGMGTMLRPVLGNVPIIREILPDVPDAQLAEEMDYPYNNLTDAIERIKELEAQVAQLQENKNETTDTIASLQKENERLKVFEDNQLEFEDRVAAFDENVVFADEAPEIEEYKSYYEEISPENAEKIYEQVIKQIQFESTIEDKAEMFRKMKPKDAAKILEEMTADTESVAKILMSMDSKYSSLILAEMNTTNAAKVTKKMLDLDEERLQSLQ